MPCAGPAAVSCRENSEMIQSHFIGKVWSCFFFLFRHTCLQPVRSSQAVCTCVACTCLPQGLSLHRTLHTSSQKPAQRNEIKIKYQIIEAVSRLSWANPHQTDPTRIIRELINTLKGAKERVAQTEEVSSTSMVTSGRGCKKFYQHIKVAGVLLLLSQDGPGKCPRYLQGRNARLCLSPASITSMPFQKSYKGREGEAAPPPPSPLLTRLHVVL